MSSCALYKVRSKRRGRKAVTACGLLLLSACGTSQEIKLPAIDASEATAADALVVHTDYSTGFSAPGNVISGAGKGATHAMGEYVSGLGAAPGEGIILGILLLPLALPVSAGVGAALAHSPEEVEAARTAFAKVGEDEELVAALGDRVVEKLQAGRGINWSCVSIQTDEESQPCEDTTRLATLKLRPLFDFAAEGRYNPEIHLTSSIYGVAKVENDLVDSKVKPIFTAKWIYREELGNFFELTENDAALMRQKIEKILDQIAARIANDVFLAPHPAKVVQKTDLSGRTFLDVPEGTVVRVR